MESNIEVVQPENSSYEIIKPTEKEFQNHHLLHTVKQVNGDFALRQVQERASILKFTKRAQLPSNFILNYFGYVSVGEVFIYKQSKSKFYEEKYHNQISHSMNFNEKVFVTSHKAHEIFGFQEYPLNWSEHILIQGAQGTKIILFPVQLSLTSFRKIFNLNVIQYRAEMLKRCEFFHGQELEKLKKIALYSKRCQGSKGQILIKQGDVLAYLIVIISGESFYIRGSNRKIISRDQEIGLEDLMSDGGRSQFFLSCLTECEFILVPRNQAVKLYKIKYKLDDKESVQYKSRRATEYENKEKTPMKEKQSESMHTDRKKPFFQKLQKFKGSSIKIRPNTSINRSDKQSGGEIRFSTFYEQQKTTPNKPFRHFKTQISDEHDTFSRIHEPDESNVGLSGQNISLGELCLRKFLNRKEKRENCEIMKYLKSNAPQLKLNPSKDYALVKPLHVGDSSYVKNFKRKLKRTYIKNGGQKQREEKRSEARFSFFFKQDSISD